MTTAIAHGIRVVGINDCPTHRGLANAELGLPDDAYWAQRWRTFHTQHWERYVDRDDPGEFDVSNR